MGVRKYRRVEDMPEPPPARAALDGLAAACELSEMSAAIGATSRAPRGVRRFRSVEEAAAHRESWEVLARSPDS